MKSKTASYFHSIQSKGFALIATISVMALVIMIAMAMVSLSTSVVRTSNYGRAMEEAQANARMALVLAIGQLQKEMGPDMRISAEAAIHDTDPLTEVIEGVAQPHWLAVYDSWGNWLNGEYTPIGNPNATGVTTIQDTYVAKRSPMFRRWLVSLPSGMETNIDAAVTGLSSDDTSVILVGPGTLGETYASANPSKVTRAFKNEVGVGGKYAWLILPENHKAKVSLAAQNRTLSEDQWQLSQGSSSEVAIGKLPGFEALDASVVDADKKAEKIISFDTMNIESVGLDRAVVKSHFFDLTNAGYGLLTSAKTGSLKEDLSLLFEHENGDLPDAYRFVATERQEKSIRPLSDDISAYTSPLSSSVAQGRPFTSWSRMQDYYRMYRNNDIGLTDNGVTSTEGYGFRYFWRTRTGGNNGWEASHGFPSLLWQNGNVPYSQVMTWVNNGDRKEWIGQNCYQRFPLLAKMTYIYSVQSFYAGTTVGGELLYDPQVVFTPVVTMWNPYNTDLSVRNDYMGFSVELDETWPVRQRRFVRGTEINIGTGDGELKQGDPVRFNTRDGSNIVFKPGEFKVFSLDGITQDQNTAARDIEMYEGFDPLAIGGVVGQPYTFNTGDTIPVWERRKLVTDTEINNGEVTVELNFSHTAGWNTELGITPGSCGPRAYFGSERWDRIPSLYFIDWFNIDQNYTPLTQEEGTTRVTFPPLDGVNGNSTPTVIAYSQVAIKTIDTLEYDSINWERNWNSRNWLHAPPYYFGSQLYASEDPQTLHTQRVDSPYIVSFGAMSGDELTKIVPLYMTSEKPMMGTGANPFEKITALVTSDLPTSPPGSLASFSNMRMSPGWIDGAKLLPDVDTYQGGHGTNKSSMYASYYKSEVYHSGITGAGIGNSFIHPMIPREEIFHFHNNSISMDQKVDSFHAQEIMTHLNVDAHNTKAYADYWDHSFVLNDALWDNYFISSLSDQRRVSNGSPTNEGGKWLDAGQSLDAFVNGASIPNSRYRYYSAGKRGLDVKDELESEEGYLKAAGHVLVDGVFNVNSTSKKAWLALFHGIRERALYFRDTNGGLHEINIPSGSSIALSRFDVPRVGSETTDISTGVARDDSSQVWSGVRFLSDADIELLAVKCVQQVKRRGPFLNFSEFINRRLEDSDLGLMGALQSAIDYDDVAPDPASINYSYKVPGLMMSTYAGTDYQTPQAGVGSRLAGVPGYVLQSDLLKPIANNLTVRDDTFRIRTYGESIDAQGRILARAWCEAIVQRIPEYIDSSSTTGNEAHIPARKLDVDGKNLINNTMLTELNRTFGRKFKVQSFKWLLPEEI